MYRERVSEREKEVVASIVTARWQRKGARDRCLCALSLYSSHSDILCSLWAAVVFPIFGFSTLTYCAHSHSFMFSVFDPTTRLWPSGEK